MEHKISFYIFSENIDEGVIRATENVYNFVDEIIVRVGVSNDNQENLGSIDRDNKVKIIRKKFTTFAGIRNICLENCLNEWILTLDSDEVFSQDFLKKIRNYAKAEDIDGYKVKRIHFYGTKHEVFDPFSHLRFFRNSPKLKYLGLVHELLSGVNKARVKEIGNNREVIYHYNQYEDMVSKNKEYRLLLKEEKKLAIESKDSNLIDLADFRLWSNANIDNPEHFQDKEKMQAIMTEFSKKLEEMLGGRENYHKELGRLERMRLKSSIH